MLTLNKPPCFYDISSQVSDVEERTTFQGTKWSNARVQSNAGATLSFIATLIQREPRCLKAAVRTGLGLGVSGACARQRVLMATEPLKFNNSTTIQGLSRFHFFYWVRKVKRPCVVAHPPSLPL